MKKNSTPPQYTSPPDWETPKPWEELDMNDLTGGVGRFPPLRVWNREAKKLPDVPGIKTGFPAFDTWIPEKYFPEDCPNDQKRSRFKTLIAITGEPEAGKTTLAINLMGRAVRENHPCIFLQTETGSSRDVMGRMHDIFASSQLDALDYPGFGFVDEERLISLHDELTKKYKGRKQSEKGKGHEMGKEGTRMGNLFAVLDNLFDTARAEMIASGIDPNYIGSPFLFLDSVHEFPALGEQDARAKIDEIITLLKKLGRINFGGMPITIVAVCHSSREIQTKVAEALKRRTGKDKKSGEETHMGADYHEIARLVRHSGKESGKIEYAARAVLYVSRHEDGSVEVICGKNTNGTDSGDSQVCKVTEEGYFDPTYTKGKSHRNIVGGDYSPQPDLTKEP